eukprot:1100352-Prymnesium_polylepis.1
MEPEAVRIHTRRRSQPGGGNGVAPLKPEEQNAEPAGRASASYPAATAVVAHNNHEQCKGT